MNRLFFLSAVIILLSAMFVISCQANRDPEMIPGKDEKAEAAELPFIYHMTFLNRYAEKLYFAGKGENWKLAEVYNHELEEVAEILIQANDIDDGINRSKLVEDILIPQIEEMDKVIDAADKDAFNKRYNLLIQTCNICHDAADYGAIEITIPQQNLYNQNFSADN